MVSSFQESTWSGQVVQERPTRPTTNPIRRMIEIELPIGFSSLTPSRSTHCGFSFATAISGRRMTLPPGDCPNLWRADSVSLLVHRVLCCP